MKSSRSVILVSVFAVAFAFVEASVVMYLREVFYPEGFAFPLKPGLVPQIVVEIARELATIVMLVSVGIIAGKTRWQRFSYFLIAFGLWDLFFYIWLNVILNWPASLLEWDVLFLIPVPWIGPVVAPVLVSMMMIAGGWLILKKEERLGVFHASRIAVLLTLIGTAIVLCSFLLDTEASLRFHYPKPYRYELLVLGLLSYIGAFITTVRGARNRRVC